jgi:hypothetical protein
VQACGGGGSIVDAELRVDVVEVSADRAGRDPESGRDLAVSAFGDMQQHFGLTLRERAGWHGLNGGAGMSAYLDAAPQLRYVGLQQVEQRAFPLAEIDRLTLNEKRLRPTLRGGEEDRHQLPAGEYVTHVVAVELCPADARNVTAPCPGRRRVGAGQALPGLHLAESAAAVGGGDQSTATHPFLVFSRRRRGC